MLCIYYPYEWNSTNNICCTVLAEKMTWEFPPQQRKGLSYMFLHSSSVYLIDCDKEDDASVQLWDTLEESLNHWRMDEFRWPRTWPEHRHTSKHTWARTWTTPPSLTRTYSAQSNAMALNKGRLGRARPMDQDTWCRPRGRHVLVSNRKGKSHCVTCQRLHQSDDMLFHQSIVNLQPNRTILNIVSSVCSNGTGKEGFVITITTNKRAQEKCASYHYNMQKVIILWILLVILAQA